MQVYTFFTQGAIVETWRTARVVSMLFGDSDLGYPRGSPSAAWQLQIKV